MPTGPFNEPGTDGYSVFQNDFSETWIEANPSISAFDAVLGGYYNDGVLAYADQRATWWSSTAMFSSNRAIFEHIDASEFGNSYRSYHNGRRIGYYVRCILKNASE